VIALPIGVYGVGFAMIYINATSDKYIAHTIMIRKKEAPKIPINRSVIGKQIFETNATKIKAKAPGVTSIFGFSPDESRFYHGAEIAQCDLGKNGDSKTSSVG
jgi:hypothetical protein